MPPLGHIVERCAGFVPHERCDLSALIMGCIARAAHCPQPPARLDGLSREEETERGMEKTSSMPLMLIYSLKMLPFFMQLLAKTLNVDVWSVLIFDCALF